jgi:hypothetical protein
VLAEIARTLLAPLETLFQWAAKNKAAIEMSRKKFAATKAIPKS